MHEQFTPAKTGDMPVGGSQPTNTFVDFQKDSTQIVQAMKPSSEVTSLPSVILTNDVAEKSQSEDPNKGSILHMDPTPEEIKDIKEKLTDIRPQPGERMLSDEELKRIYESMEKVSEQLKKIFPELFGNKLQTEPIVLPTNWQEAPDSLNVSAGQDKNWAEKLQAPERPRPTATRTEKIDPVLRKPLDPELLDRQTPTEVLHGIEVPIESVSVEDATGIPRDEIHDELDKNENLSEKEKTLAKKLADALYTEPKEDIDNALSKIITDPTLDNETIQKAFDALLGAYENKGLSLFATALTDGSLKLGYDTIVDRDGHIWKIGGREEARSSTSLDPDLFKYHPPTEEVMD